MAKKRKRIYNGQSVVVRQIASLAPITLAQVTAKAMWEQDLYAQAMKLPKGYGKQRMRDNFGAYFRGNNQLTGNPKRWNTKNLSLVMRNVFDP